MYKYMSKSGSHLVVGNYTEPEVKPKKVRSLSGPLAV